MLPSSDKYGSSGTYTENTDHNTKRQIKSKRGPITFRSEHPHIVCERRVCGETSAETGNEKYVLTRTQHFGMFHQSEKQTDNETAYYIDKESAHRERSMPDGRCPFTQEITADSADKATATCNQKLFKHNMKNIRLIFLTIVRPFI